MAKVALIKGENRYENVMAVLDLLKQDVAERIKGKKRIVLKPNFVSTQRQLAATHIDTMRAILDFLKPLTSEKVTIAENAAAGPTRDGFENFGYLDLPKDYNVELVDLQETEFEDFEILDSETIPVKVEISRLFLESDFLISPAILKTHNSVIATLSIKNIAVAALKIKSMVHQGAKATNLNLAKIAEAVRPHFAIIDGFEGMEGEGPINGDAVPSRVALASFDCLAADSVGARLMGLNPDDIGYLHHLKEKGIGKLDLEDIEIAGNTSIEESKREYRLHSSSKEQFDWK